MDHPSEMVLPGTLFAMDQLRQGFEARTTCQAHQVDLAPEIGLTTGEMADMQAEDPDLKVIINKFQQSLGPPHKEEMAPVGPVAH